MKHTLKGIAETRDVYLDNEWLDPKPSQKWHNHSPDGFNWGYGGSGPAQLALAINMKLLGHPAEYHELKWNLISKLPQGKDFEIEFEI